MKQQLSTLLLFLSLTVSGFAKVPLPTDSTKVRLAKIEKLYNQRADSLQRELVYYKVKEDYFANAVSQQTSLYLGIFGIILAIASFANFGYFGVKFRSLEKNFDDRLVSTNQQLVERLERVNAQAIEENATAKSYNVLILVQLASIVERLAVDNMLLTRLSKSSVLAIIAVRTYTVAHTTDPLVFDLITLQKRVTSLINMLSSNVMMLQNLLQNENHLRSELSDHYEFIRTGLEEILETQVLSISNSEIREKYYAFKNKLTTYAPQAQAKISELPSQR